MKKIIFSAFVVIAACAANAQPPKAPVTPGSYFGAKVSAANAMPIAQLPGKLKGEKAVNTKVKGKVLDVCAKKGCWMSVQVNDSTTAFVKMKDYAFFVPTELIGKTVVIDGKANIKTTPVDELQHYAKDAKKPQSEIDAITQPKSELLIMANGIVVAD